MAAGGRFVWYDLMTTDVEAAKSFYRDIVGWKTIQWSKGDYEMWTSADTSVGGVMLLPADTTGAGALPHWIGYVGTENVDASVQTAQKRGGRIVVPATDIAEVGRFAMLTDPQGAEFAVFHSLGASDMPPDSRGIGHFGWAELNTTDWKSAWKFYSDLLGWKPTSSMDMGPELGEYFMFGTDPKQSIGGMSNTAKVMKRPPSWLHYINVKSVDDAVQSIEKRGGKVLNGPMEVPGGDRIVQAMDPQGGLFALFSSKPQ